VAESAARAQGLHARFAQTAPIPLDVEIRCGPGELVALFGPSGSGKTTILRSIAGLYEPAQAFVQCDGEIWADVASGIHLPPQRRAAGVVFQDYALFPHMTVRGQLLAAMDHLPRTARASRVNELIEVARLDGLAERRPASLSGGQQQRVAIARALAREPRLLLLDEPFASVDRALRDALHREFLALRHELRIPIVLVTHDFDDVARLASHLVMLDQGRVTAAGTVTELTAQNLLPGVTAWREPAVAFDAQLTVTDARRRLSTVRAADLELLVPLLDAADGTIVRLQIAAREVILATERPAALSIHNVVPARVAAVEAASHAGSNLIRLLAGGVPLLALVTADAVERLAIAPGREVFALVKAMAIDTFA
jgi:molybdate transport system ATP-binding protein